MEQALDRPNFDEMAPVSVGLNAVYGAHETEVDPITEVIIKAWPLVRFSLAAIFLFQVLQLLVSVTGTLRRRET